jgi:hypothetical protein
MADLTRRIVLELLARNKAAGELAAFTHGIDGLYRGVRRMASGLLAMAGIGGFGYMIKQQMEAVHTTTNLAARLGMTTEALVGLQHAAKLTDVEQEQLTRSLDFFNRTLGDAQMGSASAAKAFTAIGISFKDLAGLNPEQKIGMVADQINKLGTQSQKAATVQDIFGRGSQALLGLLSEGSKGIAAYRLETEKLGLSFSQVDAAKVEMAIESLTRMRAVFTGLFRRTAIELAPYIEAAANAFIDWATAGEGVGHNVTSAFEMMTKGAVRFGAELQGIGNHWLEMKADVADVVALWEKATPAGMLNAFIREKRGIISPADLALQYRDQKTNTEGQINAVEQFYANLRKEAEQRASAATNARRYVSVNDIPWAGAGPDVKETKKSTMDVAAAYSRMYKDIDSKSAASFQAREQLIQNEYTEYDKVIKDKYALDMWYLDQQKKLAIERGAVLGGPLEGIAAAIAEMKQELPSVGKLFYDMTKKGVDGLVNSLSDAVFEAKNFGDAMEEVGRSMAKMAFEWAARQAIVNSLSGVGGMLGLAPVAHAGGTVGATRFPTRMVDPGVFAHAPRLHSGLASDEFPAILQRGEEVRSRAQVAYSGGGSSSQRLEALMGQVVSLLSQRQTINLSAKVVDSRDVMTAEQMEGRRGEQFVMRHVGRNS